MEIEKDMINCPECGEEIKKEDENCKHCGSWLEEAAKINMKNEYSHAQSEGNVSNVKSKYSNIQPIKRTALFIIVTAGLYQIYWFYRNWRDFKAHKNIDINVGLRTLGLFVPLVNLYLVGTQFRDIKKYAEESDIKPFSIILVVFSWAICMIMSYRLGLLMNPIAILLSWILTLGLVVPFSMAQKTLNEYWIKEQGELPIKRISGGEILVIVIGCFLTLAALTLDILTIII